MSRETEIETTTEHRNGMREIEIDEDAISRKAHRGLTGRRTQ